MNDRDDIYSGEANVACSSDEVNGWLRCGHPSTGTWYYCLTVYRTKRRMNLQCALDPVS